MSSPTRDRILREAADASSFFSRCLFYSDEPPPQIGAPTGVYSFESFSIMLNGVTISLTDPLLHDISEKIVAAYSDGINKLSKRYVNVVDGYDNLRWPVKLTLLRLVDREKAVALDTMTYTSTSALNLLESVRKRLNSHSYHDHPFTVGSLECESVRSDGKAMMDEIAFLCKRVDEINNSVNARVSTVVAILAFLLALWIPACHESARNDESKKEISRTQSLLSAVKQDMSSLIARISEGDADYRNKHEETLRELTNLNTEVAKLLEFSENQKETSYQHSKWIESMLSKSDSITERVAEIRFMMKANEGHVPATLELIRSRIDELDKNISDLRVLTQSKKIPQIDINLPRQDPPVQKKAIGLLNIDTSDTKSAPK